MRIFEVGILDLGIAPLDTVINSLTFLNPVPA